MSRLKIVGNRNLRVTHHDLEIIRIGPHTGSVYIIKSHPLQPMLYFFRPINQSSNLVVILLAGILR